MNITHQYWTNFFFLSIIICSCIYAIETETDYLTSIPSSIPTTRVAFVFAGSARTFIFPSVKNTIKQNLITSFCPVPSCYHDVFVRVSSSDNNHVGSDAHGRLSLSNDDMKLKLNDTVQSIKPTSYEGGNLYLTMVDIGSKEEMMEMVDYGGNDLKHRIYRDLDPRRYSMYFNRYKVYEQVIKHEMMIGMNYSWIIFARLDCGWGAPIMPVHTWSNDKLYASEIWNSEVPDTFAIIPHHIADIYFNMTTLMQPKVLCLGGPNLNVNTLQPSHLKQLGYNDNEISYIQQEDCRIMYPEQEIVNESNNVKWSNAGLSELFLKRRLKRYGYNVEDGSIKLIPTFMYILRYPLEPLCMYCKTEFLISWVKINNWPQASFYPACFLHNHDIKHYEAYQPYELCRPSGVLYVKLPQYEKVKVVTQESCLLRPENTDLNFLPFRIRTRQRCLTSSRTQYEATITSSSCINYNRDRFLDTYTENQLYHFYPLIGVPQKIQQYTRLPNEQHLCMTVMLPSSFVSVMHNISDVDASSVIFPIELLRCSLYDIRDYDTPQMFMIDQIDSPRLKKHPINQASSARWKPLSLIKIKWFWQNPSKNDITYCMTTSASSLSSTNANSTSSSLWLSKCYDELDEFPSSSTSSSLLPIGVQTFMLERAVSSGQPYRHGIMVGKRPSWSDTGS